MLVCRSSDPSSARRRASGQEKAWLLAFPGWRALRRSRVLLHFEGRGRYGRPRRLTSAHSQRCGRWFLETDTQTDVLLGKPKSAICVQRFDDSLNSAIHTTYRSWLRSSSMHEPRDPPLKVVQFLWLVVFCIKRDERMENQRGGRENPSRQGRPLSSLSALDGATPNYPDGSR